MKYLKNLIFKGNIIRNVFERKLKEENIYDFPHLEGLYSKSRQLWSLKEYIIP